MAKQLALISCPSDLTLFVIFSLFTGTAVEISGIWKPCPPGKKQSHELETTDVTVVGATDPMVGVAATLR